MNDDDNISLESLVNDALDDSIDELSSEVRRRLTPMRIKAAEAKKTRTGFGPSWQIATAFTVVIAVTFSWQFWPVSKDLPSMAVAELSPFAEVLEEDLEMLDQLEFVYWMAEENVGESNSETVTL